MLAALLTFSIPAPEAAAQDSDAGEVVITLEEALRRAQQQNTGLLRAQNQQRLSDISVREAWLQYLPQLSLSTSGQQRYGRNFLQEEGRLIDQTTESLSTYASASVTVFDGFARSARLREARQETGARQAELARTRQDVAFDVLEAFLNHLQQQALVDVQQETRELRRQQLERLEAMIRTGARPPSERFQQEAALAEAEQQLAQARRGVLQSRSLLIQLLALDPEPDYRFVASGLEAPPATPQGDVPLPEAPTTAPYDTEALLQRARAERSDLRARELGLEAARQGLSAAQGSRWPSLSLSAGYGTSWTSAADIPFTDQLDRSRGGSVGLSLSLPIFDRLQTRGGIERAEVNLLNARYDLEDLERTLAVEVRQAVADWELAETGYEAAARRLEAARQALRAAEERYRLGAAPLVELVQASADRSAAAAEHVRAYYDLLLQQKRLDYLEGTLDPAEGF